ncbi:hypothetical protein [Peptoniphilus asaccharolyticus]
MEVVDKEKSTTPEVKHVATNDTKITGTAGHNADVVITITSKDGNTPKEIVTRADKDGNFTVPAEGLKDLKINIDEKSILLIVDYYNDEKIIVLECEEDRENLQLKSKYLIIDIENVGMTKNQSFCKLNKKAKYKYKLVY